MNEDITANVGDVVYAKYLTYDGVEKIGYFLIISKDSFWLSNLCGYNALKISTDKAFYEIELGCERFGFLQHTSYINCGHQQRLYPSLLVKNCGVVGPDILCRVVKQLENFNKDVNKQLDTSIKYFNRIASAVAGYEKEKAERNLI